MSPRTRQLFLLFGVAALVALAGCGGSLGGPDNSAGGESGDFEERDELHDATDANETSGDSTDGDTGTESGDEVDEDSSPVEITAINETDDAEETNAGDSTDSARDGSGSGGDGDAEGSGDGNGDAGDEDGSDEDEGDSSGGDALVEPDQSLLTLTVVDEQSEPIEGVSVAGQGEPHEADVPLEFGGETNADGQYVDEIYENNYTIELEREGYNATTLTHVHDGEYEIRVTLESDAEATGVLEIEVLETTWGGYAEGVEIYGERQEPDENGNPVTFTAETGADGMASADVPYGTYDLELGGEDYEPLEGRVDHRETDERTPPALFEINLIPPEYELTVTVVDEDGTPVDGVDIEGTSEPYYADRNDSFEVTGVNGSTTVTTLGEGMVTVTATPTETDHEPATGSISLRQNDELTIELESASED